MNASSLPRQLEIEHVRAQRLVDLFVCSHQKQQVGLGAVEEANTTQHEFLVGDFMDSGPWCKIIFKYRHKHVLMDKNYIPGSSLHSIVLADGRPRNR